MKNIDQIRIDLDQDIIFMTMGRYKFFLSKKEEGGMEAKELYEHLIFTAKMQSTNTIKANDIYLRNGLGWGIQKLKKAKAFLKKYNMIDYKQNRTEDGKMGQFYIKVFMITDGTNIIPPVQETAPPVDRPTGDEKQMLLEKVNTLNNKVNISEDFLILFNYWSLKNNLRKSKYSTLCRNYAKKKKEINAIFEDFNIDTIKEAIDNYDIICGGNGVYWWTHKTWQLWDFIIKGLDRFLKEANPLNEMIKDKKSKMDSKSVEERYLNSIGGQK